MFLAFVFLLFFLYAFGQVRSQSSSSYSPLVFGYIEPRDFNDFQRIINIDGNRLTHVIYAFAFPNITGNVTLYDPAMGIQREVDAISTPMKYDAPDSSCPCSGVCLKGFFHQLIYLKRKFPHLKTILSIGGWTFSKHFSKIFADEVKSALFIQSATDLMLRFGFDGIDIDWEFPGKSSDPAIAPYDWTNVATVTGAFKTYWEGKVPNYDKYLLTLCLPATNLPKYQPTLTTEILEKLVPSVDYFFVMAYEYQWGSAYASHGAPVYFKGKESSRKELSIASAIIAYRSAIPTNKMVLGLPAYAMGFEVERQASGSTCLGAKVVNQTGTVTYLELQKLYPQGFINPVYDSASIASWTCNTTHFYSFDSPTSAKAKMEYIVQQKLAGAMLWDLSTDFHTSNNLSIIAGLTSTYAPQINQRRKRVCIPTKEFCNVACADGENPFEWQSVSAPIDVTYKYDSDITPSKSGSSLPSNAKVSSSSDFPGTNASKGAYVVISFSLKLTVGIFQVMIFSSLLFFVFNYM